MDRLLEMRTNSGDTSLAIALADKGIVFQPTLQVGHDLQAGTLVDLFPGWHAVELGIHAV